MLDSPFPCHFSSSKHILPLPLSPASPGTPGTDILGDSSVTVYSSDAYLSRGLGLTEKPNTPSLNSKTLILTGSRSGFVLIKTVSEHTHTHESHMEKMCHLCLGLEKCCWYCSMVARSGINDGPSLNDFASGGVTRFGPREIKAEETWWEVTWHLDSPRSQGRGVEGRDPNGREVITRGGMDNYIRTRSNLPGGSVAPH